MSHSKRPPLELGPIRLDFPVGLAALAGYSDWPTRVIARRLGAGFTATEAMLDRFIIDVTKGRKSRRYVRVGDDDHPTAAQVMGGRPETVAAAAVKLAEAGFDWVDINFGCPVKKVLGKCRGGYLLGHPREALEIVARTREAMPPGVPLTVKMRRGIDDSPESRDHFYEIFDGVFRLGVAAVTLHPRTVRQRYEGPSSWAFLREAKQHAGPRVVLGSGDLFEAEDCLRMIAETGVDGATAARGAIGNPWIFRQVRSLVAGEPMPGPPDLSEQREVISEHYRLADETYGAKRSCATMRKIGIKYAQLHPQADEVREAFVAVCNPLQWQEVIDRWYTA